MTYTDLEMDALKEIINIGGGHAATSISQLVERRVDMHVPEVAVQTYNELYEHLWQDDEEVYAIACPIEGEIEGIFLFIMTKQAADKITRWLTATDGLLVEELKISAIQELTNIVSNSFLNAITEFLGVTLYGSLPTTSIDYFGAIISSIYLAYDQYDEQVLCIRNEFTYDKQALDTSLFLVPGKGALETLFQSLGI
ncbi:chemotaxis protein CheC [Enterococcus italicus]|uniref:chemotaxis protein CheC n=1 Tax=Enterococcus italicus TaxID=246144 RepID=UPI0028A5D6DC|nr:chemotaxis protein CheC [Enterococcus italicus]